jgi:ribose transport system permease protein
MATQSQATERGPVASLPPTDPSAGHSGLSRASLEFVERAGLPILLLILFAFFALDSKSGSAFLSGGNIQNILGNQAVTGLVALAMVVPLVAGYFDLSVSAITGVANVAVAATIGTHGWPIPLALLFGLGIGGLIGFVNGFLVAKLRLNGFVVTLGTYTFLLGVVQWYTQGQLITNGIPLSFGAWGSEKWLGMPRPFILLIVVAFVIWYVLTQSPYGRFLEGIGSNESAARLVGINTERVVWISFIISGALAAMAGALQTSRAGSGDPQAGTAFLFPALAAVFLGATTIKPGRYNVWGAMVGVYFVAVSVSGFTLLGADVWVQPVFNGLSLVVAVALSTLIARRRESRMAARLIPGRSSPPAPREPVGERSPTPPPVSGHGGSSGET